MSKLTKNDHLRYLKVAVEITKNYGAAQGHAPMIENIYKTLCKIHDQIPEDTTEEIAEQAAPPPAV